MRGSDGTRRPRERGSATLEAMGAVALAALLVLGIVAVAPGSPLGSVLTGAVCAVRTQAPCATGADAPGGVVLPAQSDPAQSDPAGPGGQPPTGDTGGRAAQDRQTRNSRQGRGEDKAPDSSTVPGPAGPSDPLGTPVAGTSVPEPPVPAWNPVDKGSGEYDSSRAWPWDYIKKAGIEAAANAMALKWPDAARNLLHYLGNTGEPLEQDVNKILHDVPDFAAEVDQYRMQFVESAVRRAAASGITGPVTFPVSSQWQGYYLGSDENWYRALGGVSYSLTGQITVVPPTSPGGAYTYQISTRVNLLDQYNWDKGKSTSILGLDVPDSELARLHLQGLAREYRNQGAFGRDDHEGNRAVRQIVRWVLAVGLVLAVAGCTGGGADRPGSTPTAPATGPTIGSVAAFQEFSGLTLPATASGVAVQVTAGPDGQPAYKVVFSLPSADVDAFCTDGGLSRPLEVTTIPEKYRKTFDYRGDAAGGVAIGQGSLPSNPNVQREVMAVGISKPAAEVRVFAYTVGN